MPSDLAKAIEKLKACRLTDVGGAPKGAQLTPLECEAILNQLPSALVSAMSAPQSEVRAIGSNRVSWIAGDEARVWHLTTWRWSDDTNLYHCIQPWPDGSRCGTVHAGGYGIPAVGQTCVQIMQVERLP